MAQYPKPFTLDLNLRPFCTDRQWEVLEAWAKHGSHRKAGEALGLSKSSVCDAWESVKIKAARHGYAPDYDLVHPTAPGMDSKGTSHLYDAAGNPIKSWYKTKPEGRDPAEVVRLPDPKTITKLSTLYDQAGNVTQQWIAEKPDAKAQVAAWQEFAKALTEDLPRAEPIEAPGARLQELMACYPVGDHHLGMLSWGEETDNSYDLKIGESMLQGATDYLIKSMPSASACLIVFLGDFMHYDSFTAETPTAHNKLDADSRFPKMVRASFRAMRYLIEKALGKHFHVHVIVEVGNHDLSSSTFLMEALANIYESETRVTIDTSPMHFHYYRHGQNLIGTHHGHGVKMAQLPLIMATDRKKDWGETTHRMWWTGHIHHAKTQANVSQEDFSGCTVESFRILAPKDAWHAQKGYRPTRGMQAILLHEKYGEKARHTVTPEMFRPEED